MARRTSGSSSTVNKTGFGIFLRCGARDFVAYYEDCCIASASIPAALKLQLLTLPCPALSLNSLRTSRPRTHPEGLRPPMKSTGSGPQPQDLPVLTGGPQSNSPNTALEPLLPPRCDSTDSPIRFDV